MLVNTNPSNKINRAGGTLTGVYCLSYPRVTRINATTDEGFISILTLGFIAGTLTIIIYGLAVGDRTHKETITIALTYVVKLILTDYLRRNMSQVVPSTPVKMCRYCTSRLPL